LVAVVCLCGCVAAFNWCLFKGKKGADLDFINAGSLSLNEMRDWLKPDEVLFPWLPAP
jgi:hypothetical protein